MVGAYCSIWPPGRFLTSTSGRFLQSDQSALRIYHGILLARDLSRDESNGRVRIPDLRLNVPYGADRDRFEYLWQDSENYKRPTKMSAPGYIEHLMNWVQSNIDNEQMFPSRTGMSFRHSLSHISQLIRVQASHSPSRSRVCCARSSSGYIGCTHTSTATTTPSSCTSVSNLI